MRWVLIGLLLCNGIYYLWQASLPREEMKSAALYSGAASKSAGQRLILLRELPENQSAHPLAESTDVEEGVFEDITLEEAAVEEALLEIAESLSDSVTSAATDNRKVTISADDAFCWSIGPFREEISAKQAVGRLAAAGITLEIKTIAVPTEPDYWVYVPPLPSKKMAIKLLRELQSKKIDSFLITSGELNRGLSLGFFSQRDRAETVHRARLDQGYSAKIKLVKRYNSEFWGTISAFDYEKLTEKEWENARRGNKGLEKRKNFCDKIASTNNLD